MTFYIAGKKTIYIECVAREVFHNFVRNNKEEKVLAGEPYPNSLFVLNSVQKWYSGSREQNGVSLLTPVSDSVFIALSDGAIHFACHGSPLNHNLIG